MSQSQVLILNVYSTVRKLLLQAFRFDDQQADGIFYRPHLPVKNKNKPHHEPLQ